MLNVSPVKFGLAAHASQKEPAVIVFPPGLAPAFGLPVPTKENVGDNQQAAIEKNLHRWFPTVFSNNSTPLWELLASPAKSALISSGLGAFLGILWSGFFRQSEKFGGAVLITSLGAIAGGVLGYIARKNENGNIQYVIDHGGTTYYDYEADPVTQGRLNRQAMSASGFNQMLGTYAAVSLANNVFRPSYGRSYASR